MSPADTQAGSGDFGRTSMAELREVLRSSIQERLRGTKAAAPRDVEEVVIQLLTYALSLELLLCRVSGRKATIPGYNVSVRGLVEQVLGGESSEVAWRRLSEYLRDAYSMLTRVSEARNHALEDFAAVLAEELNPVKLEGSVRPTAIQRLLGVEGHAYWTQYRQRFLGLDQSGLMELAEKKLGPRKGDHA